MELPQSILKWTPLSSLPKKKKHEKQNKKKEPLPTKNKKTKQNKKNMKDKLTIKQREKPRQQCRLTRKRWPNVGTVVPTLAQR